MSQRAKSMIDLSVLTISTVGTLNEMKLMQASLELMAGRRCAVSVVKALDSAVKSVRKTSDIHWQDNKTRMITLRSCGRSSFFAAIGALQMVRNYFFSHTALVCESDSDKHAHSSDLFSCQLGNT
jgi:hypothetical protein